MQDTHRIILTNGALSDLDGIASYIRKDSPQNAANVATAILNSIDSLAYLPTRYERVGKSRKRGTPVHSLVVRPFVIYYRVEHSPPAVYILHIRDGRRRQPRRFE